MFYVYSAPMADRRKGRPPLDRDDLTVKVTISLPSKQFDVLCAEARRHDVSIPEAVRRELYGQTRLLKTITPKNATRPGPSSS